MATGQKLPFTKKLAMVHMTIDMAEEALASLRTDPVKWYELRRVSQERAAKIAGLSRAEFIAALVQFGVSPFQATAAEALEEACRELQWSG